MAHIVMVAGSSADHALRGVATIDQAQLLTCNQLLSIVDASACQWHTMSSRIMIPFFVWWKNRCTAVIGRKELLIWRTHILWPRALQPPPPSLFTHTFVHV